MFTTSGRIFVDPHVGHKIPSTRTSNERRNRVNESLYFFPTMSLSIIQLGVSLSSPPNKASHMEEDDVVPFPFTFPFPFPLPTTFSLACREETSGSSQFRPFTSAKSNKRIGFPPNVYHNSNSFSVINYHERK
ncbi:LOW QUALITY PROTEIN: hypothetical protein N665_0131s0007 [Sinapis alba]|nr:LOW QUALITY PROTEIN: hypothetical protein N665_0131s0007 [Sinapis alba]